MKTRPECIRKLSDSDSAIESGPNSNLGRRLAYETLVYQQRKMSNGVCNVSYYSLLTSYSISLNKSQKKCDLKSPPLLVIDKYGIILKSSGTNKFKINETIYTRLRKDTVVNLCPYVPINHCDEVSCYSNLLMHLPWPMDGELSLIPDGLSSIQYYAVVLDQNLFPEYVKCTLEKYQHSDIIRKNVGILCSSTRIEPNDGNEYNDDDNYHVSNAHMDRNESEINFVATDLSNNNGVLTNVCTSNKTYLMNYVHTQQKKFMDNLSIRNRINVEIDRDSVFSMVRNNIPVENYNIRLQLLLENVKLLTKGQLEAYNIAVDYISGKNQNQMRMFVSGEGGTGKSFLISLIMEFTNIFHGKQNGIYGAAVAVAPTGSAANVIRGFTWQSVYGKGFNKSNLSDVISGPCAQAVGAKLNGVKLVIIDEISMINLETLYEISKRHTKSMGTLITDEMERMNKESCHFGGTHVLFTGDFYQLKPVFGQPIYFDRVENIFCEKGRDIWLSLNEYVELIENTRYRNDATPHMNLFLRGARIGKVDMNLLHIVNERLMASEDAAKRLAGPNAVWIAHNNKDVDRLNKNDFDDKKADGVRCFRIFARHTSTKTPGTAPSIEDLDKLCKISNPNGLPRYIDIAIGTRVSCTRNLGTQIGTSFYLNYLLINNNIVYKCIVQVYTMELKVQLLGSFLRVLHVMSIVSIF